VLHMTNENVADLSRLANAWFRHEKALGMCDEDAVSTVATMVAMAVNEGKVSPKLWPENVTKKGGS
jgi:hypothetical protein